MLDRPSPTIRELGEITAATDSRDYLSHATRQAKAHDNYELIVDVDAHLQEGRFWGEVIEMLENDVLKQTAEAMYKPGLLPLVNMQPGMAFQTMGGRVPHQFGSAEPVDEGKGHTFVQIVRRGMDAMGIDYQVIFPTAMLFLGMNPMEDIEIHLARAYNRWLSERVLSEDRRMLGLLYLPFNSPEECEKLVAEFGDRPGVSGFTICAVRHTPVHSNKYMRLYSMIEETGKPLIFHAGPYWDDPSMAQLNRFVSMHAISFVHYNMIHLTNWIVNALPERFPKLKVVWVESGLAWLPFMMQRLDHEILLRQNEAPGLKKLPSEYMKDFYYTSQPLERTNMTLLESTMTAINAETQLLYASDWPHWDFDPPSAITGLPFLTDQAKRNILGLNAAKLFNLEVKRVRPDPATVLASRPHQS